MTTAQIYKNQYSILATQSIGFKSQTNILDKMLAVVSNDVNTFLIEQRQKLASITR